MIIKIMLISDNRKQIRNDRSDHQANRHYLVAVILFALVFSSSLAYATEGNSSHDHNTSSNATNITNTTNSSTSHIHLNTTTNFSNSSLHVHPDTNLSVAFLMKGAAEQIKVNIGDFGTKNPVASEPHGFPIRFFKANAQNISHETLTINASYSEMELNGIDEEKLVISQHEHNNSTWIILPTKVNKEGNTLEATTDSLSLFAVSSHSGNSSGHIHNNTAEIDNNSFHDRADKEFMPISVSFTGPSNTKIALELESRNSPDSPLPENPIKFFRIDARNLSYTKVNIEIAYPDSGLNGANENNLSIFHYVNSTWTKLPTEINGNKNTLWASVDSLSLFAISSFSGGGHNMSMDMGIVSDCLRCHGNSNTAFDGGMMGEMEGMEEREEMKESVPKVNESIMNLSIHSNLNNASSNLNQACWACHSNSTTPPTRHPPMHKPSALDCSACHVSGIGKFSPPRTTEHTLHAANITTNTSCQLCHGKSEMINLNGSTENSTISHYGMKRTDMLDLNKTSTSCSYCHQNSASGFSDVFNSTLRTNVTHNGGLSCSSCHGAGRMHDSTLKNMRGYNLSNCVQCHDAAGFAPEKIDENVMNLSIHANLNNASSNINRACWACHSNSSDAPDAHPGISKSANTCSVCHVNNNVIFSAPKTTEHTIYATNIAVSATCQLCHGKSEMINLQGGAPNSTISHYGKRRIDLVDLNKTSTNCSYCHQIPASEFSDVFNNASRINIMHNGNLNCSSCHGTGRLHDPTLMNMQGYSLSNCTQCHGTGGFALNKVSESAINQSIHANLNSANISLNRACWTCHSNLTATLQSHPDIAKPPNACSTCHIDGNLNPTKKLKPNHLTQHISQGSQVKVPVACTLCHSNDAIASGKTTNSTVSHYGGYPQVETKDCVSCHQNEDIGRRWGIPPDPRETIQLASVEKKLVSDEIWKLNQNYSIAVREVDKEGQSAWLELYYNGKLIRKDLVPEGGIFKYDAKIEQSDINKTVIDLRIADIFYGGTVSLITFNGTVPKHIHTETSSIQCYACHVKDYRPDKPDGYRYFVLKKENQNVTLNQLDIDFTATDKKTMSSNESWDLGSGYELSIKDFSPDRDYVWLVLAKDGYVVKEDFAREGEYFTYNTTSKGVDIEMLRLKIANLFVKG